jgi:hypothetical protein
VVCASYCTDAFYLIKMFYMTGLPLEPFTMIRMAELIGRTLLHVFNFLVCATMDRCAEDAVSI